MSQPLVSIITPTWNRDELMRDLVVHLCGQTYRYYEHVIVSDGPSSMWPVSLGRNWTGYLGKEHFGIAPLTVGMLLARGDYQMWWADDERALVPDHVERLVRLAERTGADFVYPKVRIWRNGQPDGPETAIIGSDPPAYGQITHFLYRAEVLRKGMPRWGSHPCDWGLVSDWLGAGATWAFLPELTFEHRLDQ